MYCVNCGTKRQAKQNYCANCGVAFNEPTHKTGVITGADKHSNRLLVAIALSVLTFVGIWVPVLGVIIGIFAITVAKTVPTTPEARTGKYAVAVFSVLGLFASVLAFFYWAQVNMAYFQ